MKKIHALVMSLIMLFIVLAPAQNVEAAGKSLKVSEKAFFKEMKEFDYKGMNRYVNCEDFTFNFCMNAFYYMADGKLDNLSSMSEKQLIKLVNGIIDKSQKDTKFNRFKTKTVTIRFVKAKNCWKVQKVSDKLADVMMANFASNLQNLATFSISSACGEKSAYVIPETSEYGTVQKKVLVKVLKNIYGRKPELSA